MGQEFMFMKFKKLMVCKHGATAIEYGLIASLVVVACMAAIGGFGNNVGGMWNYVQDEVVQD